MLSKFRAASFPARAWRRLEQAAHSWLDHEGARLAASLSFYSLLSLAPLVVLSIAIASVAFGQTAAQDAITDEVGDLVGADGAHTIQLVMEHASAPHAWSLASAIGLTVLLFGASSVFGELQSAMNKIWSAKPSSQVGLLTLVRSRLISFALVLAFGFLLLVSLVLSAALNAFTKFFRTQLFAPHFVLLAADALVSFGGIFVLIALIFRYVPDVTLRWRDVWGGALATALLFTVGKTLFGLYLGRAAVASAYGAAGSLVVVILWTYYSAMIFYFGAELTCACSSADRRRVSA